MPILKIFLIPFVTISLSSFAQSFQAFRVTGRELIEGTSNLIKIIPSSDTLDFEVFVTNGSISKGVNKTMVFKNKEKLEYQDSVFYWNICESSKGLEKLIINYSHKSSLVKSDTLLFHTKQAPILFATAFKKKIAENSSSFSIFEEITPINIVGIEIQDVEFGHKAKIESFKIEIYYKDKLKRTLINKNAYLTDENKKVLSSLKKGYIKITSIEEFLECGMKLRVRDSKPIY